VVPDDVTSESESPSLSELAWSIRRRVVSMAAGKGEGYVGQGLEAAELWAVLLGSELSYRHPPLPESDRLILSTGHYSIGLWAALDATGHLDGYDLSSYAVDGSPLIPSTLEGDPPMVELTGGSLGHGLGVAAGLALGRRWRGESGRVVNVMSDGELQEGSTWEAAMFAGSQRLDNLFCVVDINRTQADGPLVLDIDPVAAKWAAFGWEVADCDGNDVGDLTTALARLRSPRRGRPRVLLAHTQLGHGVPLIAERERRHFVRVDDDEWDRVRQQVEAGRVSGR
jgi:transketolase